MTIHNSQETEEKFSNFRLLLVTHITDKESNHG